MRLRAAPVTILLFLPLAAVAQSPSGEKEVRAAWESFVKSVVAEDKEAIWSFFSADAKAELQSEERLKRVAESQTDSDADLQPIAKELGISVAEFRKLPSADLSKLFCIQHFIRMKEEIRAGKVSFDPTKKGEAVVTLEWTDKEDGAQVENLFLSLVGNSWKLSGRNIREASLETDCKNRLKQVSVYIAIFKGKAKRYPENLDQLKGPDLIPKESEDLLGCAFGKSGEWHFVYVYPVEGDSTPGESVQMYDLRPHPNGMLNVAEFRGKVTTMTTDAFHERLRKDLARMQPKIGPAIEALKAKLPVAADADKPVLQARLAALEKLWDLAEASKPPRQD